MWMVFIRAMSDDFVLSEQSLVNVDKKETYISLIVIYCMDVFVITCN